MTDDRTILRGLARQVAEIAALPEQQETIERWKALNRLEPQRPMVMVDQIPWHEMDVDGELTLRCADGFCRRLETDLRRTLYRWRHLRGDMVVDPFVDVPLVIRGTGFGIQIQEETLEGDPASDVASHDYVDQLRTEDDLEKIRMPQVSLDEAATAAVEERTRELLDDIIAVRRRGRFPNFAPWDLIVRWRRPENLMLDLLDRPSFMHAIMDRLTEAHLVMLDQLETQGLLGAHQQEIHCSGAYTDELPAADHDPSRPRTQDLWTCGMAQILGDVSPAMHREFEIDYAKRWYGRFGLVYYGCCEPLHAKMDLVRSIPHVRKVSMSPWVDQEQGAAAIGPDLVFSRKPNPALLAWETWDPTAVEKHLQETVDVCAQHDCPLELIQKDISTVAYQPQRLWEWTDIAMRVVAG